MEHIGTLEAVKAYMHTTAEAGTNSVNSVILGIPAENVEAWWPVVKPLVEKALEGDTLVSSEGLKDRILKQQHQLWAILIDERLEAVCITQVEQFDLGKSLNVIALAGFNIDLWLRGLNKLLVRYAKEHDCVVLQQYGRAGWIKKLRQYNWEVYNTGMVRRI